MFRFEGLCAVLRGLLHYMIPPKGCIICFFEIFTMCKMVIFSMYIIWKKFLHCQDYIKRLDFIYYNNIILYISNNTRILLIPPMNTTHTTLKNWWCKLISTVRSLHIDLFLLHTSPFQQVVQGGIVYRKKPHVLTPN
jgi:hypothetical protein